MKFHLISLKLSIFCFKITKKSMQLSHIICYQKLPPLHCPLPFQLKHSMLTKCWYWYPWIWHQLGDKTADTGRSALFAQLMVFLLGHVTKTLPSHPKSEMGNSTPSTIVTSKSYFLFYEEMFNTDFKIERILDNL